MDKERLVRTELVLGESALEKLSKAHVALFGLGGVGGPCAEALARSGVGKLTIVDNDVVEGSNINRQIVAAGSTIGKYKTEVMKARILDIAPDCEVEEKRMFFLPETGKEFDFSEYDYVVDAIDTVKAKIELIRSAMESGTKVISAMGAGNRIDPCAFSVTDISKTEMDPLAKVMRRELKKIGIKHLKVVFSKEKPVSAVAEGGRPERHAPGSVSFVPPVAGYILASEVVKDLAL